MAYVMDPSKLNGNQVPYPGNSSGAVPTAPPPSYAQAVGGVPPTYPYVPPPKTHTVITGPPILTTVVPVGSQPTHMTCPYCYTEIDTATKTEPGVIAYISGVVLVLMGCWLGCCFIPCCIDDCMDVHHSCPQCKAYLGSHRK